MSFLSELFSSGDEAHETCEHFGYKPPKGHVDMKDGQGVWVEDIPETQLSVCSNERVHSIAVDLSKQAKQLDKQG